MLHLSTETHNNEQVGRFVGRILIETKMDYFGSTSPEIAERWGLRPQTHLPPAAGASPQNPVQVK